MKNLNLSDSKYTFGQRRPAFNGFTLMETVIAIGVLAVLLTGFVAVFTPAAQGIRRSIGSQQADRLATTLENELVTLRADSNNPKNSTSAGGGAYKTGFDKAFDWILTGGTADDAIFVYQYRGDISVPLRADGTPEPMTSVSGEPGQDYMTQSVARRASEAYFQEDLEAIEGSVFYVKPTQLVLNNGTMAPGTLGTINNRAGETPPTANKAEDFKDAVVAFSAEFYSVPSKSYSYISGSSFKGADGRFAKGSNPVFTRNLAVRR